MSEPRRRTNDCTRLANSADLASPSFRSASVASRSLDRAIGFPNILLNTEELPRTSGLQKSHIAKNSWRLFCTGVPVNRIRRGHCNAKKELMVLLPLADFNLCPSSAMSSPIEPASEALCCLNVSYEMIPTRVAPCLNSRTWPPACCPEEMIRVRSRASPSHLRVSRAQF